MHPHIPIDGVPGPGAPEKGAHVVNHLPWQHGAEPMSQVLQCPQFAELAFPVADWRPDINWPVNVQDSAANNPVLILELNPPSFHFRVAQDQTGQTQKVFFCGTFVLNWQDRFSLKFHNTVSVLIK